MPAIQGITTGDNVLQITQKGIITSLNSLIIPSTDIATVENWLNNTYLPPIVNGEFQIQAHVFSTNPLKIAVTALNNGITLPSNWWLT